MKFLLIVVLTVIVFGNILIANPLLPGGIFHTQQMLNNIILSSDEDNGKDRDVEESLSTNNDLKLYLDDEHIKSNNNIRPKQIEGIEYSLYEKIVGFLFGLTVVGIILLLMTCFIK